MNNTRRGFLKAMGAGATLPFSAGDFPDTDGPDALEMAMRLASELLDEKYNPVPKYTHIIA